LLKKPIEGKVKPALSRKGGLRGMKKRSVAGKMGVAVSEDGPEKNRNSEGKKKKKGGIFTSAGTEMCEKELYPESAQKTVLRKGRWKGGLWRSSEKEGENEIGKFPIERKDWGGRRWGSISGGGDRNPRKRIRRESSGLGLVIKFLGRKGGGKKGVGRTSHEKKT